MRRTSSNGSATVPCPAMAPGLTTRSFSSSAGPSPACSPDRVISTTKGQQRCVTQRRPPGRRPPIHRSHGVGAGDGVWVSPSWSCLCGAYSLTGICLGGHDAEVTTVFEVLAEPRRRQILDLVRDQER